MTKGIHPLKDFGQITKKEALAKDFPVADKIACRLYPVVFCVVTVARSSNKKKMCPHSSLAKWIVMRSITLFRHGCHDVRPRTQTAVA